MAVIPRLAEEALPAAPPGGKASARELSGEVLHLIVPAGAF
jgi:hypothetical protein